ncbi:hypothetical protein AMTRI_Chr06g172840 [Amborella trichopoda]
MDSLVPPTSRSIFYAKKCAFFHPKGWNKAIHTILNSIIPVMEPKYFLNSIFAPNLKFVIEKDAQSRGNFNSLPSVAKTPNSSPSLEETPTLPSLNLWKKP